MVDPGLSTDPGRPTSGPPGASRVGSASGGTSSPGGGRPPMRVCVVRYWIAWHSTSPMTPKQMHCSRATPSHCSSACCSTSRSLSHLGSVFTRTASAAWRLGAPDSPTSIKPNTFQCIPKIGSIDGLLLGRANQGAVALCLNTGRVVRTTRSFSKFRFCAVSRTQGGRLLWRSSGAIR